MDKHRKKQVPSISRAGFMDECRKAKRCRRMLCVWPAVLGLLVPKAAFSQDILPEAVTTQIEQLAERAAEAGGDGPGGAAGVEEIVRYYEELLRHPLNINAASRLQLEETGLLTVFQTESLIAWRERYGAVRSLTEWAQVEGFSPGKVEEVKSFFTLGEPAAITRGSDTFTLKLRKDWKEKGVSLTMKELYESDIWSAGAVVDNDSRERFPDFVSLSARYRGFYAGDFTARFGQGLVIWKSFQMSVSGTPSSVARRGGGLQCYRSTDESNFFRGAGWNGTFGSVSVSAFVSRNALDARIRDGRYTSIVTGGLHSSESGKEVRHSLHEYVAGANATVTLGTWRLGVTAVGYGYDKPNGRRVQEYNRFQQYDGPWGNLGFDWYGSLGSLRLFGEAAVDAHLAPAVLAGVLWSPSYGFETSLAARCYSPSYIATHACALSSTTGVSNQIGAAWAVQVSGGGWTLRGNADCAWYPWKRYRHEAGTWGFKGRLQLLKDFRGGAQGEAQVTWSGRLKGRVRVNVPCGEKWTLSFRADANRGGAGGYADVRWMPSPRWDVSARVTAWKTDGWDSRVSFYERGVPQSFGVASYYGKGVGAYLLVKYAPMRCLEMWMKIRQDGFAYFVRIFIPG
ncbi:MAG: hypothetical protein IJJ72_02905 [Bacteroidales bacterium]|nr:hypothetical protein [Bacteroidales bacterium]